MRAVLKKRRLWLSGVWMVCLALWPVGCATSSESGPETTTYRTVRTSPDRDTEAARRHHEKGLEALAEGDLEKARSAFERALEADVAFGPAHNNLGKVLYQQKDFYQAAWEFEYARALMPNRSEPLNNLGLVLEKSGELDRAVESYRAALFIDSENLQTVGNLARALYQRGDRGEELVLLLERLLAEDQRADWKVWAQGVLLSLRGSM
ncbi:tetratricopeptide repeat protein [Mucisphaera sp.]|uniref:tetratricopeptide repeat protein n=1 Tax=Mucisphaera sp. TaxID=2913024 RepID=UPI003D0B1CC7